MKTNARLYGEGVVVEPIPQDVIDKRVELLNIQLTKELDVHYTKRDSGRANDIIKAIKFWQEINKRNV